jgi:hypothetical protein
MIARTARALSLFDRTGIVIVALLATCVGLFAAAGLALGIASRRDLVGMGEARAFGLTAIVCTAALCNGAVFGFLLYAWDRVANALADRLARSFTASGRS